MARLAPPFRLLPVFLLFLAAACGGDKDTGGNASQSLDLAGTYELVRDSTGTTPRTGAKVTLVLNADGTLSLRAVQGTEELTDTGTYEVDGDKMTIAFVEQGISAEKGAFKYDGETLEIPVLMFGEGDGSSIWRRGGASAQATPRPQATAQAKTYWNLWDLDKDLSAAATKSYAEAVQKGTPAQQALQAAADLARRSSTVAEVDVSENGLSLLIRYKTGTIDYVMTERLLVPQGVRTNRLPSYAAPRYASARPLGSSASESSAALTPGCAELPGNPAAGSRPEPGREGLHPAGGYGVTAYLPTVQPKPITTAGSPPANARRALLVAPVYEIEHHLSPGFYDKMKNIVGPSIECLEADLTKVGYAVDKVLGTKDSAGKWLHSGDQAVEEMTKFLTFNRYGFLYFLTHGTEISSLKPWAPPPTSAIYMGVFNQDRAEFKKVINGRKITPEIKVEIAKELARIIGLRWDDNDVPIVIGSDFDGSSIVWIRPSYFRLLREQMQVSFDSTLVMVNACSSGKNTTLPDAIKPRAFFGWKVSMEGDFISDAAETIVDSLTDKARSARNAWWMYRRHEAWVIDGETTSGKLPRNPNQDPVSLAAFGVGSVPYEPITSQTIILIYRVRHGPGSAASDISASISLVQSCFDQFWSSGRGAGLANPACRPMEFGSQRPTQAEINDAFFEVGGIGLKPFGRFTLAD
jgi:hypothetical protein